MDITEILDTIHNQSTVMVTTESNFVILAENEPLMDENQTLDESLHQNQTLINATSGNFIMPVLPPGILIYRVFLPIIIPFGLCGNILSFFTLKRYVYIFIYIDFKKGIFVGLGISPDSSPMQIMEDHLKKLLKRAISNVSS